MKWPKVAAKITEDLDRLLTYYDFSAEHWIHLKTANPIESTFATVRLRTHAAKGPGSRAAGVAMTFKLIRAAQSHWRRITRLDLLPLVRAGVKSHDGIRVERPDTEPDDTNTQQAATESPTEEAPRHTLIHRTRQWLIELVRDGFALLEHVSAFWSDLDDVDTPVRWVLDSSDRSVFDELIHHK